MFAMLGRTLHPDALRAAVRLGSAAPEEPASDAVRVPPADLPGYRELVDAWWRQESELRHLRETLERTETVMRSRDRALSKLDQEIQLYSGTPTRKVVVFLRMIYGSVRRDARAVARLFRRRAAKGEMQ
jgi:hypothetical protein